MKIRGAQYLAVQGRHARREDGTGAARVRAGAVPRTSLGWSFLDGPTPEPRPTHDSRYDRALVAFLKRHGARRRGRRALGLHLLVNVSPGWIEEGGDLHDPANPRVRAHWNAVVGWAREAFGTALFALRIDLDETGGGVADAFLAPLRRLKQKGKTYAEGMSAPLWLSVNRAMEEMTTRFGLDGWANYSALNSSWSAYAQEHLDPRLQRGEPKARTGRKHMPMDDIRAAHGAFDARKADLMRRSEQLDQQEGALARVMAAALAGRISVGEGDRLEIKGRAVGRVAHPGGRGEQHLSPEDTQMLHDLRTVEGLRRGATRELIQLIERATSLGTGTAARQAHAEPERIGGASNGAYAVLSGGTTVSGGSPASYAVQPLADGQEHAPSEDRPDPNDPFAVLDPSDLAPRPW